MSGFFNWLQLFHSQLSCARFRHSDSQSNVPGLKYEEDCKVSLHYSESESLTLYMISNFNFEKLNNAITAKQKTCS